MTGGLLALCRTDRCCRWCCRCWPARCCCCSSRRAPALRRGVPWLSLAATLLLLLLAVLLAVHAAGGEVPAYLLGNWPAPFGIALALDRLGALMVLLTALVACGALVYALGGDAPRAACTSTRCSSSS